MDVFAGEARLSTCLRMLGLRTATLDIEHWPPYAAKRGGAHKRCRNPLDLLTVGGFAHLGFLQI